MDDQKILELYFARDEQAIRETEAAHGGFCMGVAMNILQNHSDAEECVNDTWLKAWGAIPPARPNPLRAFLGKITRNLAITRYRANHRRKRDENLTVALSELEECIPMREEDSPYLRELLNGFLDTLEPLERRLFVGRYWHAYTPAELAKGYGLTRNAVNLRIMRTREKLRAYLEERGYHV